MALVDINDVLNGVSAAVVTLGLNLNGTSVPVYVRKQGIYKRGAYPSTVLEVIPATQPEDVTPFASGWDKHTFQVQVLIFTPSKDDYLTNLDTYSAWRLSIIKLFSSKPADLFGLDNLRKVWARPGVFMDPESSETKMDVQAVDVIVEVIRDRTQ